MHPRASNIYRRRERYKHRHSFSLSLSHSYLLPLLSSPSLSPCVGGTCLQTRGGLGFLRAGEAQDAGGVGPGKPPRLRTRAHVCICECGTKSITHLHSKLYCIYIRDRARIYNTLRISHSRRVSSTRRRRRVSLSGLYRMQQHTHVSAR